MTTLLTELETLRRARAEQADEKKEAGYYCDVAVCKAEERAYAHAAKLAIQYSGVELERILARLDHRYGHTISAAKTAEDCGHPQDAESFRMRAEGLLTAMIIVKGEDEPVDEDEPGGDMAEAIVGEIDAMIIAVDGREVNDFQAAKDRLIKLFEEVLA